MRIAVPLVMLGLIAIVLFVYDRDSVSYRPAPAPIVDRADCAAPGLDRTFAALTTSPGVTDNGTGFPPRGFDPVAVVRCERGVDDSGTMTIDSVRLEGDVDAAWEAFNVDSQRFPDNVQAGCAVLEVTPVRLWFVDSEGRAVRPSWPVHPCGYQDQPITALSALREVDRAQEPTAIPFGIVGACGGKSGSGSTPNAVLEVGDAPGSDRRTHLTQRYALAFPVDDAGPLQVCRYLESAYQSTEQPGSRLSVEQSRHLVRAVVDAPPAAPCSLVATRTARIPLYRADGSGGAHIDVELDGCRRASAIGIPDYLAVPDDVVTAVSDR